MKFVSRFSIVLLFFSCLAAFSLAQASESDTPPIKVVYHIDDAKIGRFALEIAAHQLQINPQMKIAMVAYGAGVDFLLKDASDVDGKPYSPAIQDLLDKGAKFKVCLATLRFRDISKTEVLEGLEYVPAGTYEVVRLQADDGYVYLKP